MNKFKKKQQYKAAMKTIIINKKTQISIQIQVTKNGYIIQVKIIYNF